MTSSIYFQVNGATGQSTTYAELQTQVTRAASALVKLGIQKGDVITLSCPNCPEFAVLYLAIMSIGAVASAVNPLYTTGAI